MQQNLNLDSSLEIQKILKLSSMDRDLAINELAKNYKISVKAIKDTVNSELAKENKAKRLQKIKDDENYLSDLFKLQGVQIPPEYYIEDGYLHYQDDKKTIRLIKLFAITKILRVEKNYKYEIASNSSKDFIDAKDIIDNKQTAYHFADRGELITPTIMNLVSEFIRKYLQLNEGVIPMEKAYIRTGFQDEKFILPNREFTFLDENISKRFTKKGTLEKEIEMIKLVSKGKVLLPILFGLATPLQGFIEIPLNFICHLGGFTGEGKTFAIRTAVSLFGNPKNEVYGKNYNSTNNGLESYCDVMRDVPCWIDELESSKYPHETVSFLYQFSEGNGRGRAFVNGRGEIGEREQKNFRGGLFSTGEKSIFNVIKSIAKTKNMPLGLVRRSLDIDSKDLWKNIDGSAVLQIIENNYGNFIDYWLEHIEKNKDKIIENFNKIYKTYQRLDGKEYLFTLLDVVQKELVDMGILTAETKQIIEREYKENIGTMEKIKTTHLDFFDSLLDFVASNKDKFIGIESDIEEKDIKSIFGRKIRHKLQIKRGDFEMLCSKEGVIPEQMLQMLKECGICTKIAFSTTICNMPLRVHEFDTSTIDCPF
ncbi:DUF927 domain-containing protein [Aliarcobacter cryaerophilus]|uniref:DUF927 domain-containing protein n=1 Tax=Aliarcobacter cryaerophilus TaxID=28198 RepID=UPI0021B6D1ED|nr:DUF927 domain-containing protein [Aliarcobacter cryaerophilus]MCT7466976.1 DUF927 domain-containing protein [Aliarcobacter cryaerophilus]